MVDPFVAGMINVPLRSERAGRIDVFCALVNHRTKKAVDRSALGVGFDEILHYFRSNFLQHIPEIPDDGKVPANRLFLLNHIEQADANNRQDEHKTQKKVRINQSEQGDRQHRDDGRKYKNLFDVHFL